MNQQIFWLKQLKTLFIARCLEFLRDRSTLIWNLLMPVFLVVALSLAFTQERPKFTVIIPDNYDHVSGAMYEFLNDRYVLTLRDNNLLAAREKLRRHQIDMVLDPLTGDYWVNRRSANGYLLDKLLQHTLGPYAQLNRQTLDGDPLRYIDWVLPGILSLNIMFGSLWGVGFAIVRYRNNGVLKRLSATPISAIQFLLAQLLSRLILLLCTASIIYLGLNIVFDFTMQGSYFTLLSIYCIGAISLISIGVLLASRTASNELASGIVNLISWPMMMLCEVWFSLEGASPSVQALASLLPLGHIVSAARAVMIDGAGMLDIAPQILYLLAFSAVSLFIGVKLFRWQ